MIPEEKGRYCGSCKKVVVDFSSMSDAQLMNFFKTPKDAVCGRFGKEQLERDIVIEKKRLPWINYFFGLAFPAFLLSLKSSGQSNRTVGRVKVSTEIKPMALGAMIIIEEAKRELVGIVYDNSGMPY